MELQRGESSSLNESTQDSPRQESQNAHAKVKSEMISVSHRVTTTPRGSSGITSISEPSSSHKNAVVSLHKDADYRRKNIESSSILKKTSSSWSNPKTVRSTVGITNCALETQTLPGSTQKDTQPSVLGLTHEKAGNLSSVTVPVRMDILAYLLNHGVMSPCNVMPQVSCFGSQCSGTTCRNVSTSPYWHITQTTCCCCRGTPTTVGDGSVPICTNQPQNSTGALYPNNATYSTDSYPSQMNPEQSPNYSRTGQVVNRYQEITSPSERRWEQNSFLPSSTGTQKCDDPKSMETQGETSCSERRNGSFGQSRASFSRNDLRNASPQRSSGNWKTGQNDGTEWQQRNVGRPNRKCNDSPRSNCWRAGGGDQSRGSTFSRERSFRSDFGNRKRSQAENSSCYSQDSFSSSKQPRWSGFAGGSWQVKRGHSDTMRQAEHTREKSADKIAPTLYKGKTLFASKDVACEEDWDAEYETQQSNSSVGKADNQEEETPIIQHANCLDKSVDKNWETERKEERELKQNRSLQLQNSEEKTIDVGKKVINPGKKVHFMLDFDIQSNTPSNLDNIFNIMEKDESAKGVPGETLHSGELQTSSLSVESEVSNEEKLVSEMFETYCRGLSTEDFTMFVSNAVNDVEEHTFIIDTNKGCQVKGKIALNTRDDSCTTLIIPSEKYESMVLRGGKS